VPGYFEIPHLRVDFSTFSGLEKVLALEDLKIAKGEAFGLVGESGSGKSVLALSILNLLPTPPAAVNGEILLEGENLLAKHSGEMRRIRGKRISMIFQDPMSTLNPVFTVGDQMTRVIRNNKGVGKREARQVAREMIELVELPDPENVLGKYPHQLSGGQRQRIIIALALSCGAEFLIADEPTRNLDVTVQAGILKLLSNLRKELDVTVLFVANNLGLVSAVCDRVGVLLNGRIVETGAVREVVRQAAHPYTLMLLKAIPKHKGMRVALRKAGQGERLGEIPGCGYVDRCAEKIALCELEHPPLRLIEGTHFVACTKPWRGGEQGECTDEQSAVRA